MSVQILAWVKANPIKTGAAVIVGGVGIYLLMNAGQSSTGGVVATTNTGPTDAQIAAQTQVQLAQISAGGQAAGYQYEAAAHAADNQTQLALAQLGLTSNLAGVQASLEALRIQTTAGSQSDQLQYSLAAQQIASGERQQQAYANSMFLTYALNAKPKQLKALQRYGILDYATTNGTGSTVPIPGSGSLPGTTTGTTNANAAQSLLH